MVDFENVLGIKEIAQLTGLKEQTIRQYKSDGKLPDPDAVISGNPLWNKVSILDWVELGK
ncbi:MAG: hypothetical protein Unbinned1469contig1000_40 [Prokaryotic dsDNA virus sp.]|jgi:predicted DNA-binding transcriptional regulator AlpA|nr:MAG: hypothetical protein Unbinned1469contig1000_40 [Prokaryotic dsDNA virus sp.]|tara:strand:+ start:4740 stop:4919 length:180 start_codon:yes stop_codon:yes gene_type:complete